MPWIRVAAVLLGAGLAAAAPVEPGRDSTRAGVEPSSDRWETVQLAVARDHASSGGHAFWQSLLWWADQRAGRTGPDDFERVEIDGDALDAVFLVRRGAVHIRGALAGQLETTDQSSIVIGESLTKRGYIVANGIAAIHIQGDLDGVVECHSMTELWVEGDLRGQVLTGSPSTDLHVKGSLQGVVRPVTSGGMLTIDVAGHAASSVLAAIDDHAYTSLSIAVAESDLNPGIHPLWSSRNGFVAVTGTSP
jgi:hypothetical protein